jgi:hypothetical protein
MGADRSAASRPGGLMGRGTIPPEFRARLEAARFDTLALLHALNRDLGPHPPSAAVLATLADQDADCGEASWALISRRAPSILPPCSRHHRHVGPPPGRRANRSATPSPRRPAPVSRRSRPSFVPPLIPARPTTTSRGRDPPDLLSVDDNIGV